MEDGWWMVVQVIVLWGYRSQSDTMTHLGLLFNGGIGSRMPSIVAQSLA